jgi:hypothetical protein
MSDIQSVLGKDLAISLPVKSNLRDFGIPAGRESSALRPAIEKLDKARARVKKKMWLLPVILAYLIVPFVLFLFGVNAIIGGDTTRSIGRIIEMSLSSGGSIVTVFFVIPWTIFVFVRLIFVVSIQNKADEELQQALNQYASDVTKYFKGVFKDATAFSHNRRVLVYSNEVCAYFSIDTGIFVAYNKSDIKEVTRERVRIGSSYMYPEDTDIDVDIDTLASSTATAIDHYEWHLDILTGFAPHPKISMVIPDRVKWAENEIAKAYAVLKP